MFNRFLVHSYGRMHHWLLSFNNKRRKFESQQGNCDYSLLTQTDPELPDSNMKLTWSIQEVSIELISHLLPCFPHLSRPRGKKSGREKVKAHATESANWKRYDISTPQSQRNARSGAILWSLLYDIPRNIYRKKCHINLFLIENSRNIIIFMWMYANRDKYNMLRISGIKKEKN